MVGFETSLVHRLEVGCCGQCIRHRVVACIYVLIEGHDRVPSPESESES